MFLEDAITPEVEAVEEVETDDLEVSEEEVLEEDIEESEEEADEDDSEE